MSALRAYTVLFLGSILLITATWAQGNAGFYPSRILLSGPKATSFLVGNTSSVTLSLAVINNTTAGMTPRCDGNSSTGNWSSSLVQVGTLNVYKVTLDWNRNLTRCSGNETNCCSENLCVVEALLVSACENNSPTTSLLIQAEIYVNTTSLETATDTATMIPNQAYQPLGPCPCNLTAGACDILCCCDTDCNSNVKELFNGSCYTGIFGGNVTPPFDQLCSVQAKNRAPDWFPFLCVESSMDNSPFLGYFYQGSTRSPSPVAAFNVSFQTTVKSAAVSYKQGDAILVDQNGNTEYFTIPQQSAFGVCENNSPVAYLHNFNVTCVSNLASCADGLKPYLNQTGIAGSIVITALEPNSSMDKYISTYTGIPVPPTVCENVILSADYTFIWEANNLRQLNSIILTANISLTHQVKLTQRFSATFLNGNSSSAVLSGNPGYQVGKPVIAANGTLTLHITAINLWKPAGDSSCTAATLTPVLFGQNSFSGCLLSVVNEHCTQLRNKITALLKSLVPADYIAMRGNSNISDLSEWVPIIYEEPNATCSGNCAAENLMCLNVPTNMNIQIMTAVTGAVEGIPQQEIIAAKIRFQMTYTEYDCEKNDACWQQLAYPLTKYYTGEPHHLTLAKGMILVFFFIAAAVLGEPWNRIRKAWNNTTF
ncbi:tectonic-2 isoform 2-T2 [Rhinophrynus dorsalis]